MENYYYNLLDKEGQAAYHAMYTGLKSLAPSFSVPLLDNKTLGDIYFCLRLDHPEIFYSISFKYRYYNDALNAELFPEYLFEKKKIQDHQKAMQARVEKLARPAKDLGEKEKLLYIHDFICENVHYDKLKKPYSHEIIGPLGQGVGVCEGIAKSVKALCDALGVWCIIAICDNNPEKGIKYRHTWNIVKIEGKYYHIDVTFDNSLSSEEGIRYDYFMLSDKQVFKDHEPVIYRTPACSDGDKFYYREKKLSFTKEEEVIKRAAQAAKKGKTFTFQWRGGYLTRDIMMKFLESVDEEAAKKERRAKVYINWPQAVSRITFEKIPPEELEKLSADADTRLVSEEANEGEQDQEAEE